MIDDGKEIPKLSHEFDTTVEILCVCVCALIDQTKMRCETLFFLLLNSIIKMVKLSTLKFFMAANGNFC